MDTMEIALKDACFAVGGQRKLALLLGKTPQSVNKWMKLGRAPAEECRNIERYTGVSRYRLRPDVFGLSADEPIAA